MKIKSKTVRMRRRGGETKGRPSPRSTTRVGTRGTNTYTKGGSQKPYANGRPPAKDNKQLVYIGLASCFAFFMLVVIIVLVNSSGSKRPVEAPKSTSTNASKSNPRKEWRFGAKYAPYDPRMEMTEETKMAKDRKRRRVASGK